MSNDTTTAMHRIEGWQPPQWSTDHEVDQQSVSWSRPAKTEAHGVESDGSDYIIAPLLVSTPEELAGFQRTYGHLARASDAFTPAT